MNMIVCAQENGGIGYKGALLVDIPEDKAFFREKTTGGIILGGRKTMESLPGKKALPNRENLVFTHRRNYTFPGAKTVCTLQEVWQYMQKYPSDKQFVIGGGEIYRLFLPYCNRLYITKVYTSYPADTFFPPIDKLQEEWNVIQSSPCYTKNNISYRFLVYERKEQRNLHTVS